MKKIFALFVVIFVFSFVTSVNAQGFSGNATKYGTANPSIAVENFSGPDDIRKHLELVLRRCDWFRVLPSGNAASASVALNVQVSQDTAFTVVSATVRDSVQGAYAIAANDTDPKLAVLKFVDALLKRRFNVPGLCARKIVFVVRSDKGKKELFSCYLDGSNYERVTHNGAICTEPSWGNEDNLVYTMIKDNALQVVYVDFKNNRQRVVSNFKGLNSSPALSANGRFLALPLSIGNKVNLYIIDLSNGSKTALTNDKFVESSPCWSPDGSKICYVSDVTGRPQLFIVPAIGGTPKRLQLGGNECVSPDWSPVSNKLCFTTRSNAGQYVIKVLDMNSGSSNPQTVTTSSGDWEAPSWAPDGRHIICTRTSGGSRDLYMIDTELKTFSQITKGMNLSLPAWQPAR